MYRYLTIAASLLLFSINLFGATESDTLSSNTPAVNSTVSKKIDVPENGSADELFKKAASFYSKGRYAEAASTYEAILERNGSSFELYYNLGNAWYKANEPAHAILNYERALRMKPGDRDARFNLELCQTKIVDKIDPVGVFLLTRWYRSLGNNFNSNDWAIISIVFFILFISSLFAYFFSRKSWPKKAGFYLGILSLLICIMSLVFSSQKYHEITNPDQAILFSPTVTVKSSPDQSGTDLFILHEGTKVTIKNEIGSWKEIELPDGNVGWVESRYMETI